MLLKLIPYPTKSEQDTKSFISLSPYIHGYMRKQNAVIILKFDYMYTTKVCIHACACGTRELGLKLYL